MDREATLPFLMLLKPRGTMEIIISQADKKNLSKILGIRFTLGQIKSLFANARKATVYGQLNHKGVLGFGFEDMLLLVVIMSALY